MKLTIISLSILVLAGCGSNDDFQVTQFVKEHRLPIIVKTGSSYDNGKRDLTLIASDGSVLLLQQTQLMLPETITEK